MDKSCLSFVVVCGGVFLFFVLVNTARNKFSLCSRTKRAFSVLSTELRWRRFALCVLTCSSWQRHWPRSAHRETIGVSWVGSVAETVPAAEVSSGGFCGRCFGLAAWAVAAGARAVAGDVERW